jgi:hypothetical protein
MLQPYANAPTRGHLNFDPAVYTKDVVEVNRLGFQVFTHAIGDRGIRMALDAYEQAAKVTGDRDLRDSVELEWETHWSHQCMKPREMKSLPTNAGRQNPRVHANRHSGECRSESRAITVAMWVAPETKDPCCCIRFCW